MKSKYSKHGKKLLVLNLDGARRDVIKPMIEVGELPSLVQMMKTGAHGNLESMMPPFSPPA
jgi:predicted AlkP superfamily phosphohydrolase/phosphomutase